MSFYLHKRYRVAEYASEAAAAVINYPLKAEKLSAGRHPQKVALSHLLRKLGFRHLGMIFTIRLD